MNPFMSYTQSFNESMTKDDREDAERRMATVKPVTAGIATPTAIQAAQNGAMTKDDREDAERRMAMQAASTPRQIVPSAQLSTAAPEQQYPLPMSVTSKPVSSGIATPTAIQAAQNGAMTKDDREDAERRMLAANSRASYSGPSGSGYVQPVAITQSNMTKDDREDAERRMAYVKPVTAGIATPAAIQAAQNGAMTKDDREDAERRMLAANSRASYSGPSGSGYVQPVTITQSNMTKDDREDAERRMATAKPVTAGIATPAAIQAAQSGAMTKDEREAAGGQSAVQARQSGDAIQETQDAIAAAFKALSVSRSQGTVNVGSFNFARRELLNAKDALAVAKSRSTPGEQVLMSQLEEQVDTIQGEVNIQLRYLQGAAVQSNKSKEDIEISTSYKTPGYRQPVYPSQVRQSTPTGMTMMTTSPVIIPGTKDAREAAEAAAAAGTDWAKLALQIGAAYLLFA